jgi:hypothetical protein
MLAPQFLSSTGCACTALLFKYPHRKESRGLKSGERAGQETELHLRDKSNIQDNFRPAVDTLHGCNVCSAAVLKRNVKRVSISIFQ